MTYRCDYCQQEKHVSEGLLHCQKDSIDVCSECRSKMNGPLEIKFLIQNQRFWKNQWIGCPILVNGIKILDLLFIFIYFLI